MMTGDRVRIVEGTYRNWEGEVVSVSTGEKRVIVLVPIFGKLTALNFHPSQIQRLSEPR